MGEAKKRTVAVLGATGGVGSALCAILRESAYLYPVALGRDVSALSKLSSKLDTPTYVLADAGDIRATVELLKRIHNEHGGLGGIANCVGTLMLKSAHRTGIDEWRQTISANLDSAFAVLHGGTKLMQKSGGSIVLVSSAAARTGLPNHEAIAAAKAGVEGLTMSAAASYARNRIRVNCVAPGMVRSKLTAGLLGTPAMEEASIAMHPAGRLGRPEDIAKAISWLLSDESDWVTGEILHCDGGLGNLRPKAKA